MGGGQSKKKMNYNDPSPDHQDPDQAPHPHEFQAKPAPPARSPERTERSPRPEERPNRGDRSQRDRRTDRSKTPRDRTDRSRRRRRKDGEQPTSRRFRTYQLFVYITRNPERKIEINVREAGRTVEWLHRKFIEKARKSSKFYKDSKGIFIIFFVKNFCV